MLAPLTLHCVFRAHLCFLFTAEWMADSCVSVHLCLQYVVLL